MQLLGSLVRPLVDFALPPRCPGCGAILPEQGQLCVQCWSSLNFLTPPWCAGCGAPFAIDQGDGAMCGSCLADPPVHDGVRAAVAYGDVARDLALKLKYGGRVWLAGLLAGHLQRFLPEDRAGLIIAPVPLHWSRLWVRGFNQSALIAVALHKRAGEGTVAIPDLLVRHKRTPPLRAMNPGQRARTVAGAFRVHRLHAARLNGARVILIDDVFTSGATANACVRALRRAGAAWVQVVCWARVLPER